MYHREKGSDTVFFRKKEITSFSKINLRISRMRLTEVYEIINKGESAELTLFFVNYSSGEKALVPQKSAEVELSEFVGLLNDWNILGWNGFFGPNPRHVRDGYMFLLEAEINGEKVRAEGSNNFPKHYHEFVNYCRNILN